LGVRDPWTWQSQYSHRKSRNGSMLCACTCFDLPFPTLPMSPFFAFVDWVVLSITQFYPRTYVGSEYSDTPAVHCKT
jgi:hypothetical protein